MGVYTRPDSPWYWLLLEREGEKPLRRKTDVRHDALDTRTRKENRLLAEQKYHAALSDLARGSLGLEPTRTALTFAEFVKWWRTHELPKHRGQDRERDILKVLLPYFGAMPIRSITKARVSEYETYRLAQPVPRHGKRLKAPARTISPRTINRETDLLKTILKSAAEQGHAANAQIAGKKRLHTVKPVKARLTPEDEAKILAVLDHPGDRAILIMGLDTLARQGDLIDFQWSHDHGKTLTILDPKNGTALEVPVSHRLRTALDGLPRDPKGSGYVFWHRRLAKLPRDWRGSVQQMLSGACKRAGVPYGRINQAITFHAATRRTGASRMLARGASLETVRSIGGWNDLRSMQGYLVAEDDDRKRAVEVVSNHAAITSTPTPPAKSRKRR